MDSIVSSIDSQPLDLSLLTETESHQLLVEWNQTQADYPQNQCIHQWFESQVELTPERVAVIFEKEQLTYRELNSRANKLAHYLQTLNVGPEVMVGICLERSLNLVIGLLGILKAGGAYVPLDPAYPQERLAFMLEDSQLPVLLTQQNQLERLPKHYCQVVCIDTDEEAITRASGSNPKTGVTPENLAYIIYTSGSTGNPKGVQIEHKAVVNFLNSMRQEPGLIESDVLLAVTTISFDIAGLELYLPLIVGARIVLVRREVASDAVELIKTLAKSGATVMQATPATWRLLLAAGWCGNKQLKILCGGEALTPALANQLQKLVNSVWNVYGPTETTVWSAVYKVEPGNIRVPIGRPINNTQIYLLDPALRREGDPIKAVPIGTPGELLIGGDGLARGYLNRPELNSEKFISNPFSDEPGARLYKTGDLARYLPDGNIECLGRIDHQVKIRGFRIELGDIEAALSQHPGIREAVVVAREDVSGDKRLVAYLVTDLSVERVPLQSNCLVEWDDSPVLAGVQDELGLEGTLAWRQQERAGIMFETTSTEQARINQSVKHIIETQGLSLTHLFSFLKKKLPDYMVPSAFVVMDSLPLTPNGKVDRRALPAPNPDRPVLNEVFVAPCTVVEKQLAEIWAAVLGIEQVGIHDNFFELGGHSILAVQMLTQVQETFQMQLPLLSLFQTPTVAGLAQAINVAQSSGDAIAIDNITATDLYAEAVLDPTIRPNSISIKPVTEPRRIFLTGATGFIGAFLLHELLQQTPEASIYCLVRAANAESGKQKIRKNLERYLLWNEEFNSAIIPVIGDLAKPILGLSEQQFSELASVIDVIYHNGAFVNLIYPYTGLRAANVLGTQEILRLASQIKLTPVHFISTLDVFQSPVYSEIKAILEQDELADCEGLSDGYAQSKWVAEKLVMTARERGIPVCIYRLGTIIGHSKTGVSQTNDLISRMIKGFIQLGSAPNLELMMTLTPVDYVCSAIVHLSRQEASLGKAFHLLNPHPLPMSELVSDIHALGYPIQQVSYEKWQASLLSVDSSENALSPVVSLFTEKVSKKQLTYLETSALVSQAFDFQNTLAGLAGTPIICPSVDFKLLSTYFSYFIRSGFLPVGATN